MACTGKRPQAAALGSSSSTTGQKLAAALPRPPAVSPAQQNRMGCLESACAQQSAPQLRRAIASYARKSTCRRSKPLGWEGSRCATSSLIRRGFRSFLPARAHGQGEEPSGRQWVLLASRAASGWSAALKTRVPAGCRRAMRPGKHIESIVGRKLSGTACPRRWALTHASREFWSSVTVASATLRRSNRSTQAHSPPAGALRWKEAGVRLASSVSFSPATQRIQTS